MSTTFHRKRISLAVSSALSVVAMLGLGAQHAFAQERVTITGSQIPRADLETPAPVQIISAEEIRNSGFTKISEVLQAVTANGMGSLNTGFPGAFASGGTGISLRGLTVGSTLVLIDGHRMSAYPLSDDGQRAFVDIGSIPFEAVDRIEILKDGASAVYGSDAIAGVVNVILKKSFEGTSATAELGNSQHGGGQTKRASIMHGFGSKSSGQYGYFSFEYRTQDPIMFSQRQGRPWTNMDWRSEGGENLNPGARNAWTGATTRVLTPYLQIPGSSSTNAANFAFLNSGCNFAAMRASNCTYENTWATMTPKTENLNLLGSYTNKLNSDWELNVKASLFTGKNTTVRDPATIPFGSFAGITAIGPGLIPSIRNSIPVFQVPATYPGNTLGVAANVRALLPLSDIKGRKPEIEAKSTRIVAELNGSVSDWDVRTSAGYTRVDMTETYSGFINYPNLLTALNSTTDPFLLNGGNSANNRAFVAPKVSNDMYSTLSFVEARGSRDLAKLAGGSMALGLGVGYVSKDLNAPNFNETQQGTMSLPGSAYAVGSDTNKSAYVELVAPVLKQLELDGAIRWDNYKSYGSTTTPKVGFKFTPNPMIGVRGTVSRGFRAPAPTENGTAGALFGFNAIRDPLNCPVLNANGTPNTNAAANVVSTCNFNPTYMQTTNKNLQPEKSKSYTLGLIFEPIKGWSSTLDYYKIVLDNQIIPEASLATYNPLANAVRGAPQVGTFGDGTTGISPAGLIQYVGVPYVNGQRTETSGIEFDTRYRFDLKEYGKLTAGLMYTHMINYDLTLDGVKYQLAGTHGPTIISADTGNPKDRAQISFKWERGPWTVAAITNYVSGYSLLDPSSGATDCQSGATQYNAQWSGTVPTQYCNVKSFTYTNLNVRYQFDKKWTVYGSIVNLFDKEPPIDMQTYAGSGRNPASNGTNAPYNPALHIIGAVGRFYSLGVNYKF